MNDLQFNKSKSFWGSLSFDDVIKHHQNFQLQMKIVGSFALWISFMKDETLIYAWPLSVKVDKYMMVKMVIVLATYQSNCKSLEQILHY